MSLDCTLSKGEVRFVREHGICFASFGEGRYHVYKAEYGKPETAFLGVLVKDNGYWTFMPAPGSKCSGFYSGGSRVQALSAYLLKKKSF